MSDSHAPQSVQDGTKNYYAGYQKFNMIDYLNTLESAEDFYEGEEDNSATAGHAATLTLYGSANGVSASVLFDSGATNNFISRKFALKLGLKIIALPGVAVAAAIGSATCDTQVQNVRVKINRYKEKLQFVVLDTDAFELLLGMSWLVRKKAFLDCAGRVVSLVHKNEQLCLRRDAATSGAVPAIMSVSALQSTLSPKQKFNYKHFMCFVVTAENDNGYEVLDGNGTVLGTGQKNIGNGTGNGLGTDAVHPRAKSLLQEFENVFDSSPRQPVDRNVEHGIEVPPGTKPTQRAAYRLSHAEEEEVKKRIKELIEAGHIKPSQSPWSSPVLFAKKKDSGPGTGGLRFCIDYRALNKITIDDKYPIPVPETLFRRLHGAKVYSKLDLQSGFYHVKVKAEDSPKTAFITRYGLYEFTVMPFGLKNAPSTFMRLMNEVLKDFLDDFVVVYLDDILIFSKNEEEHELHLRKVLQRLKQHKLYAKLSKCEFFKSEVEFLGHMVSGDGLRMADDKVAAILDWPAPKTVTHVRSFLGLANFYRAFVRKFGHIAAPLTELTKKDNPFSWSKPQEDAFNCLKKALVNAPVLAIHDPTLDNHIYTDASDYAYGAVLMQKQNGKLCPIGFDDSNEKLHPISFLSHRLSPAEKNYDTFGKEFSAMRYAARKWHYLLRNNTKNYFYTDHANLRSLATKNELQGKHLRWYQDMEEHINSFEIIYKPGKLNVVADALSRRHDHLETLSVLTLSLLTTSVDPLLSRFVVAYPADAFVAEKRKEILSDSTSPFFFRDEVLCWQDSSGPRFYVPAAADLRELIISEHHDIGIAGHLGVNKTLSFLRRQYYWPGMKQMVRDYIRSCEYCQRNKSSNSLPAGLLQSLPVPATRWDSISMDFITHLPLVDGFDSVLTIVDRLSKMVRYIPTSTKATAADVARLVFDNVVCLFGVPLDIVSDRDPKFVSKFWEELWSLFGTKLNLSTAYHPQTDGQSEIMNRFLNDYLRNFCVDHADWLQHLKVAEFAYNNSTHGSTGYSPFFLNYGRHPNTPVQRISRPASAGPESSSSFASEMEKVLSHAKSLIAAAQERQQRNANARRSDVSYKVGDLVLLNSKNYQLKGVGKEKFKPKNVGPYKIIKKINEVAFKLQLPPSLKIHPVFHVSQFHPFVSDQFPVRAARGTKPPAYAIQGAKFWTFSHIVRHATAADAEKAKFDPSTPGFMVIYSGFPEPEFVTRVDLTKDLPDDVRNFDNANPLTVPKRRGRRS